MQYLENLTWAQVLAYVFRKFHSFKFEGDAIASRLIMYLF